MSFRFLSGIRFVASIVFVAAVATGVCAPATAAATSPSANIAEFQTQLEAALAKDDLETAWLALRNWTDAKPNDPVARLFEAELYVRLGAPAAAIGSARKGLSASAEPALTPAQRRALLALKAQAHTAVEEPAASWAAYSELLKNPSADKADNITQIARRARWDAFIRFNEAAVWDRLLSRAAAKASAPDAPLSAQIELARWLTAAGSTDAAANHLKKQLAAHPESAELRNALAHQVLLRTAEISKFDLVRFVERNREDLALVSGKRTGFAGELLTAIEASAAVETTSKVERKVPPDLLKFVKEFLQTAKTRHATFIKDYTKQTQTLTALADNFRALREEADYNLSVPTDTWTKWEADVRGPYNALGPVYTNLKRFDDLCQFLVQQLDARETAQPADAPIIKNLKAELAAMIDETNKDNALSIGENLLFFTAGDVVFAREQRAKSEARALLDAAKTPADVLVATDAALLAGDKSSATLRRRHATALELKNLNEALFSGARAFVREWVGPETGLDRELEPDTQALLVSLETLAAQVDAEVASAAASWQSADPARAFEQLDHALTANPAHAAGWMLRWQWASQARDENSASIALQHWWRLDSIETLNTSAAFATATSAGSWDLLFSLADNRIANDPTDIEAHLFRTFAAIACDRLAVAQSSLPLLEVSLDSATGKLVASILAELSNAPVDKKKSALSSANELLVTPQKPAGTELWSVYQTHLLGANAGPNALPGISSATAHAELLAGRLSPTDYSQRVRGTPEEPASKWLSALIARKAGPSEKTTTLLADAARDTSLPLVFRVIAQRQAMLDRGESPAPSLRRGDSFFPDPKATAADKTGFGSAPGQEVALTGPLDLGAWPMERPLRLRGITDSAAKFTSTKAPDFAFTKNEKTARWNRNPKKKTPPTRLWEFRDLALSGTFKRLDEMISKQKFAGSLILDGSNLRLNSVALQLPGVARLNNASGAISYILQTPDSVMILNDVDISIFQAEVSGRLNINRGQLKHTGAITVHTTGSLDVSDVSLTGKLPWATQPGARSSLKNVVAINNSTWPATLPAGWSLQNTRIVGPVEKAAKAVIALPAPNTAELWVLAAPGTAPTATFATLDELQAALDTSAPGSVLALAPGKHRLRSPLIMPPGITITGTGSEIGVSRGFSNVFVFRGPGASSLRAVTALVDEVPGPGGSIYSDMTPKTALHLDEGTWVFVSRGNFYNWSSHVHTAFVVMPGAQLDLAETTMAGKERVEPRGIVRNDKVPAKSLSGLREIVARRTREDLWARAALQFTQRFDAARTAGEREGITRVYVRQIAEAGKLTGSTTAQNTRQIATPLAPRMAKFPVEVGSLNGLVWGAGDPDAAILREVYGPTVLGYLNQFSKAFTIAQDAGKVQEVETALSFLLAYPAGSENYGPAMNAFKRGLTVGQFEAQMIADKKAAADLAAALARQREQDARYASQYPSTYRASSTRSSGSSYSAPTYSAPPLAPAWKPSESYQMQVYRHNLDVQISRAVGR
ncbi:hypothetical protein [Rariglobus hedericola]|uniref:Tetratricopeptide repeat protein n=1 Tax=Rariglobus hedericola TaxID=2597822 RepID=A0A556QDK5_9BACT|nr:hypothetical protein [Rariglobus hedericola]TSJ74742.1 hypothetical protein FPL22_17520 [Rariglobus hedericola]